MPGLKQLQELKANSPNGSGMSDLEFALALHKHYYEDMPLDEFLSKNGLDPAAARQEVAAESPYAQYLADQGAKAELAKTSFTPTGKEDVGNVEGVVRSLGQGLTFGFGDELTGAARALAGDIGSPDYWANLGQRYAEAQADEQRRLKAYEEKEPGFAAVAEFTGGLLPGVLAAPFTGGGSLAPTLGRAALMGGLGGFAYGYGKAEDPNDPGALFSASRAQQAIPTAGLSALGGMAGQKIASMIKPTVVDDTVKAAADVLDSAGVKALTAGQKTGSEAVQAIESRSGKKVDELLELQKQQFAKAIWDDVGIRTIGRLAGIRTPKALFSKADDAAMQAADNIYTAAYAKLESFPMLIDSDLNRALSDIANRYRKFTPGASFGLSDISPTVRDLILKIKTAARSGAVSADGSLYNQMYKRLGDEIADPASSYETKKALGEIQDALSDALSRGIDAKGGGASAQMLLKTLRKSRQKFYAVEDAAKVKLDNKYFDPARLFEGVSKVDPDAVRSGTGRLANMAKLSKAADIVGVSLKAPPKDSPIALRYSVPGAAGMLTPGLLGVTGLAAAPAALLTGIAGYYGARLGEKALRGFKSAAATSPLGQKVLTNEAPEWLTGLVSGTGEGIAAAAPQMAEGLSDTFGLGEYSDYLLPY